MRFIDLLRKKNDSFDVKTVDPKVLLNYVDPHFIGIRNLGKDSQHTTNWKRTLHVAKVMVDSPVEQNTPTTLITISIGDQLMINDEGFSSSNWLIYPGMLLARKTIRSLHELAEGNENGPIAKLIHTVLAEPLHKLYSTHT